MTSPQPIDLPALRRRLEDIAPDFPYWNEGALLYDLSADAMPEVAVDALVSRLELQRSQAPAILRVLLPHLEEQTVRLLSYRASRKGNTQVLGVIWDHLPPWVQNQALEEAGRREGTELLDWVLARRPFPQGALEGALTNAVWQGGSACVDRLIGLVKKPSRTLDDLRKKGDPERLLKRLDEAWARAIECGKAAVPDGRVATPKFQASLPGVWRMARARQMDEALPASKLRMRQPGTRL